MEHKSYIAEGEKWIINRILRKWVGRLRHQITKGPFLTSEKLSRALQITLILYKKSCLWRKLQTAHFQNEMRQKESSRLLSRGEGVRPHTRLHHLNKNVRVVQFVNCTTLAHSPLPPTTPQSSWFTSLYIHTILLRSLVTDYCSFVWLSFILSVWFGNPIYCPFYFLICRLYFCSSHFAHHLGSSLLNQ